MRGSSVETKPVPSCSSPSSPSPPSRRDMWHDRAVTSRLRTPFARSLGVEYPILSVGFADGAGPELVGAVSGAGAFGVLGASGLTPEELRPLVARVRELTDRPFGANVIIAA